MREQLRGFSLGVQFVATSNNVTTVGHEIVLIANTVSANADLHDVISDVSIQPRVKTAIVSQLFASSVSKYALLVFNEIILLEHPSKLYEIVWALEKLLAGPLEKSTGSLTTTSRVRAFARAVLSLVDDMDRLKRIEEILFEFRNIVEENPRLRRALSGVGTVAEQRVAIVQDLTSTISDIDFLEIVRFAASSGRIRDYVEVLDLIGIIAADLRNTRIAKIHVTKPLTLRQIERVTAAIGEACGSPVDVREIIDESVIGGVLAVVGDTIFDGSVKYRLDELRSRLSVASSAK